MYAQHGNVFKALDTKKQDESERSMNTRGIAAEYRLANWAQIIEDRAASGTTIRAFCKQAGYKEHTYYYWQQKLRKAVCQELLPTSKNCNHEAAVPAGWAVCIEKKSQQGTKPVTIEIGSCRVIAEAEVDTERLKEICRILLSLC
jgi:hypothetical protein